MNEDNQQLNDSTQGTTRTIVHEGSDHHKNAKVILVVLILLLLGVIAGLSYMLVNKTEDKIVQTHSEETGIREEDKAEASDSLQNVGELRAVEGYSEVSVADGSVNMLWPDGWGDPVANSGPIESYVVFFRYNGDVNYDPVNESWVYADTETNDSIFSESVSAGDPAQFIGEYNILRRTSANTIWNFGFGDAGCGAATPTVVTKAKIVQIEMPTHCDGADASKDPYLVINGEEVTMSQDEYQDILDTIVDSIEF